MSNKPLYNAKVRQIRDLKDMVSQSAELFGNKAAYQVKQSNGQYKQITFTEYKKDIDALGTALIDLGLKGSFIAVLGENRYEWCVSYLSIVNGTGVAVPLDKELPLAELENLLVRSNAKAILFSGKHAKEIKAISATLSSVKYFINMDLEQDENNMLSYKKLLRRGRELLASGDRSFVDAEINPDVMSVLIFTSGTTDLAKGVMLSHKNICSNVMAVTSALYIDSNDSALSILPLHHTYECTAGFLVMVYNGCALSFNEGLKHISKNLKETSPTMLMLVPLILESMYRKIWDQAGKKRGGKLKLKAALAISNFLLNIFNIDIRRKLFKAVHDSIGGKIRLIIAGAAALDPEVAKGLRAFGVNVLQGYGLSEFSPIVTVNRDEFYRNDSIGLPLPGVLVKIVDPDSDGVGEIVVKGDSVMLGYFENQLATEKVLKDGWLYTGDLGIMDESGFYRITGRKKNVIVTKNGKNIFPEEVETYLNKSEFILESLVSGSVDENSGETLVSAQIVPDFDAIKQKLKVDSVPPEEIKAIISAEVKMINKYMPLYKHVRHFTIREEEFAKTTTKKIKRHTQKTG